MLQNARVTVFTVSELLRENQQGGGVKLPPSSLGLNEFDLFPPHSMPNGALNLK